MDIIVPIYNEDEAVTAFYQQLRGVIDSLDYTFTLFLVNDGSNDGTAARLQALAEQDDRVVVVELSRNFGHQAALTAGLDLARGDYVITLDGDGEHPPELISEMLKQAENGFEVVLTRRQEEQNASTFKRWTSSLFYRLINQIGDTQITPGSADFRLLARPVVRALGRMREYHRFLRGMVPWLGFHTTTLTYSVTPRLGGRSKYSLRKMLRLGMDAVFSFSLVPLYISITLGALLLVLAVAEIIYVLSFWVSGNQASLAPGWSSLMFILLLVGGTLMVSLGFIGVYIGYIFQQVKDRPIYVIRRAYSRQGGASSDSLFGEIHIPYE